MPTLLHFATSLTTFLNGWDNSAFNDNVRCRV
jgi:hypothetical protein